MVLPCLLGAFNLIGGSCFGWIAEHVTTEAAHLIAYADNIENLRKQVQDLSDAIRSVEDRIEEAQNNRGAMRADAVVDRLLERMASLKEEASKIINDEERVSDCTCIIRLRLNLWACYLTSKSARKAINEAVVLLEREKKLDRVISNVDYTNCLGVMPNPDFEEFESRVLVSNQIVEALKDSNVNMVGIYGMGGTGKTTLAKQIGAELQLNGTFSYVVLATVSEKQSLLQNNYESDLMSIQKQIAGGLKIKLQGEILNDRAIELHQQLQNRDKLLIILDDIWSKFELEMVGIPVGSSFTSKLKILMTSRNRMLLENEMDSTNNYGLNSLPADDARNLFDKMVGGDAQYSDWPLIAHEVIDQCGGIPILLVTTGRALRNANQNIWEDALTQLKQFGGEDFDEEAYRRIEVSYNFLKNEEIKKLFLLCAQLDHRFIEFEDLLKYTMGLDLFKGRKKVKEVSGRLHKYLRDLKGCCLLQDGNEEGMIKMHDVVHKFATFVASRDHDVFTVANDDELEEWPSKEQFEKFTAVSFIHRLLPFDHEFPVAFDNPKLESFLMLRRNVETSFEIPDNFFVGIKGLKLMEVRGMSLSSVLVSSLSALVKLRTLCLDHCKLCDITVIGELPMLQVLSLFGSSIVFVPKEIGKLGSNLKLLDLRYCRKLKTIATGVIFRLTSLEDLRIGDSFMTWEPLEDIDKSSNSKNVTDKAKVASLEEFKNLRNLINLEIHIRDHAKMFPKDLVFKKLETFKISTGNPCWSSNDYIVTRTLYVSESPTAVEFDSEGSKALMTRAEGLWLAGVMTSISVSEMDPKGFPELKHLKIDSGNGIHYIVKKNYKNCIFPKLETLNLSYLEKLEGICDDHDHSLSVGSFANLRVLNVTCCNLLNDLFSSNWARCLLRLKEIRVGRCERMRSFIVSRESENEEDITIGFTHQLRILELFNLPCLASFYDCKQLERLPSPIPLFNKKIMFPELEVLDLSYLGIEKIWDDHLILGAEGTCWLQNLTSLHIDKCRNLRYVFTSSMVKSLAKLKQLGVYNCKSIEEIVASTERGTTGEIQFSFPKLDNIELEDLPNLKRFCEANLLECQLLRKLVIQNCRQLKTFVSGNDSRSDNSTTLFTEKVAFPNIEELVIYGMGRFKMIRGNQIYPSSFHKLKIRRVPRVRDLLNVSTPSMSRRARDLEELVIADCDTLEKVFDVKRSPMNERETCEILPFQSLTTIFTAPFVPSILQQIEQLEDKIDINNTQELNDPFEVSFSRMTTLQKMEWFKVRMGWDDDDLFGFINKQEFNDAFKAAFPNREKLRIDDTGNFKMICGNQLHPNSFSRLKILRIARLGDLLNVFTPSMSRRALDLEEVYITGCDSLENVFDIQVSPVNDTEKCIIGHLEEIDQLASNHKCIVFDKLELLKLQDLNSLTSFCSTSDCNFRFPSLNRVTVSNCSNMKFFCEGDLSTPKLIKVDVKEEGEESEARWEGNLNSTIGKMFEELVRIPSSIRYTHFKRYLRMYEDEEEDED